MKRTQGLVENEVEMFGPGTDLIVSLVAVLLLMFAVQDIVNFRIVRENQMKVMKELAAINGTEPEKVQGESDTYLIYTKSGNKIIIRNDATLQRFSFEGDVLFASGSDRLGLAGRKILEEFAVIFAKKKKLEIIKEIQIMGHADIEPIKEEKRQHYKGENLGLAANRAIEVFLWLETQDIKPCEYVISATSYGKYLPVERDYKEMNYSEKRLWEHNRTPEKRRLNRRIEIVLIYRKDIKIIR